MVPLTIKGPLTENRLTWLSLSTKTSIQCNICAAVAYPICTLPVFHQFNIILLLLHKYMAEQFFVFSVEFILLLHWCL